MVKRLIGLIAVGSVKGKPIPYPVKPLLVVGLHETAVVKGVDFINLGVIPQKLTIRLIGMGELDHLFDIIIFKGGGVGIDEKGSQPTSL